MVRNQLIAICLYVPSCGQKLTQLGSAPYTATKHAAVGLAEWLAVTYGDKGLAVSCVCPQVLARARSHPVY